MKRVRACESKEVEQRMENHADEEVKGRNPDETEASDEEMTFEGVEEMKVATRFLSFLFCCKVSFALQTMVLECV